MSATTPQPGDTTNTLLRKLVLATEATSGGGGGVTSIIAGDGINIDQSTGDVTISVGPPSGSGLVPIVTNNTGDAVAGLWGISGGYVRQYGNTVYASPSTTYLEIYSGGLGVNGSVDLSQIPLVNFLGANSNRIVSFDCFGSSSLEEIDLGSQFNLVSVSGIGSYSGQIITIFQAPLLSSISFEDASNVGEIDINITPSLAAFDFTQLTNATSISFRTGAIVTASVSGLASLTTLNLAANSNLSSLSISGAVSINDLRAQFCALPTSEVNAILVELDANGVLNGTVFLSGQTPAAPPSGAGIIAAANLVINGWTVITD